MTSKSHQAPFDNINPPFSIHVYFNIFGLKDALKFHPGKSFRVKNSKMASKTSHGQPFLSYSQIHKFFYLVADNLKTIHLSVHIFEFFSFGDEFTHYKLPLVQI